MCLPMTIRSAASSVLCPAVFLIVWGILNIALNSEYWNTNNGIVYTIVGGIGLTAAILAMCLANIKPILGIAMILSGVASAGWTYATITGSITLSQDSRDWSGDQKTMFMIFNIIMLVGMGLIALDHILLAVYCLTQGLMKPNDKSAQKPAAPVGADSV